MSQSKIFKSLEKNKNLMYNNMTKLRESNFKYLLSIARKAKGEATVKVNKILTLYNQSKISQVQTAENIIKKLINTNTEKEEKKVLKQYDKLINKYQANEPLNKRLVEKKQVKNKQANKIIKLYRNTLKFKVVNKQQAFKNKLEQITIKPTIIGSAMAKDLDAFVARSYVIARREIPRNAEFKIHASLTGTGYDEFKGEYFNINITTRIFSSDELNKFLNDFMERIYKITQSNTIILL